MSLLFLLLLMHFTLDTNSSEMILLTLSVNKSTQVDQQDQESIHFSKGSWVFENVTSTDELFAKALRILETVIYVAN